MAETSSNTGLYLLGGGALLFALTAGGAHAYRKRKRGSAPTPAPTAAPRPSRAAAIVSRFKRGEKVSGNDLLDVAGESARTGECAVARKALTQLARAETGFKKTYVNEIEAVRDDVRAACGRAAPKRKARKKAPARRRRRRS